MPVQQLHRKYTLIYLEPRFWTRNRPGTDPEPHPEPRLERVTSGRHFSVHPPVRQHLPLRFTAAWPPIPLFP